MLRRVRTENMKTMRAYSAVALLALLVSLLPAGNAVAQAPNVVPPVDMFQLPWEQGVSWVAYDGFDNGFKRLVSSPHNYVNGGAVDFAPHPNMRVGEDTSNYWVTAAAAGTVVQTTVCSLMIDHGNGWVTDYQFLAHMQVTLGDKVFRNERLGVIADGLGEPFCPPALEPDVPHLHFALRPNMRNATFSGWLISYIPLLNRTTFTRNGQSVGLFQPLLNSPSIQIVSRESLTWDTVYTGSIDGSRYEQWSLTLTETTRFTVTATPTTSGLVPLLVLLDANGNELARGVGTLTSTQPAGSYIVQVQPQAGSGFYTLTLHRLELPQPSPTPTPSETVTPAPGSPTPTPSGSVTPTAGSPTPTGPSVTTVVSPGSINVGDSATVTVNLGAVPTSGYTSTEFTCTYDDAIVSASNIVTTGLFGTDPAVAINGPQNGSFILAIAGSDGQKATTGGAAFTFSVRGLQPGKTTVECTARVSTGNNTLTEIQSSGAVLTVGNTGQTPQSPAGPSFGDVGSVIVTPSSMPSSAALAESETGGTATPSVTPSPTASPTVAVSPTPPAVATLMGQVNASKPVTVRLFKADSELAAMVNADSEGSFNLTVPAGTYTLIASAEGFLKAQGVVTLSEGQASTMPTISLLAGDIDGNNVIDQFDAMTIGMGYNTDTPAAADLNNDGVINLLDLQLLARNYRVSGALAWK